MVWLGMWHRRGSLRPVWDQEGKAELCSVSQQLPEPCGVADFPLCSSQSLLFPGGCHQEHGASSHQRAVHFPRHLLQTEAAFWGSLRAAEGGKGSVCCGGLCPRAVSVPGTAGSALNAPQEKLRSCGVS